MKTLKVNGMRCGHCKASVEEAAGKIAGVKNPQVDLEAKELRFEESAPVDMAPCARPSPISVLTRNKFFFPSTAVFLEQLANEMS